MDSVIKRMLVNVYELEGVLLLAQERGDETPETVLSIIKEKAELLLDDANSLNILEETPNAETHQESAIELVAEPVAEADEPDCEAAASQEEQEVAESSDDSTESEAYAAVASTMEKIKLFQEREQEDDDEPKSFYYEAEPEEEESESEDDNAESEEDYVEDVQQEDNTECADDEEIVVEDEIMPGQDDDSISDDEDEFIEVEDVEEVEEAEVVEDVASEDISEPKDSNINIEDAYIRNKSKDLRSAFSINDTFRFRRELFGNSAADMSDAINLVIAMNSYEEAEDYFYGDLMWDSESDEVKEFMEIIRNHFL